MTARTASGGLRQAGSYLGRIARPVFGKRGLAQAEVVLRWPEIVGAALARRCLPEKLSFPRGDLGGVLLLRVEPAAATAVQHLEPTILERINAFYGYRAVARLRLRQEPLPRPPAVERPSLRPLTEVERAALEERLAGTADPALRQALAALGESLLGRTTA